MALVEETTKRSSGVAKAGLATGITGLSLAGLDILSRLGGGVAPAQTCCSEDHFVNRYEFDLQLENARQIQQKDLEIAALNNEVKLRDANSYADQKMLEMYKYFDGQVKSINAVLGQQAVQNQANKDSFSMLSERLACEKKERQCADNSIVTYVNATFYPKMVADVTTGTTTTAQKTYNPLPAECCC